jgi:hypothetical protein
MTTDPKILQRDTALARANHIRICRAAIKRDIEKLPRLQGRERVAELILDPGYLWKQATVAYTLRMPDHCNQGFVKWVCGDTGVRETKRLGELTLRQQLLLADVISSPRRRYA